MAELAKALARHTNQITEWKNPLLENASTVFGERASVESPPIDRGHALPNAECTYETSSSSDLARPVTRHHDRPPEP